MTGDVKDGQIDCGGIVALPPFSERQLVNFTHSSEDKISNLPQELITHILLYLPTHDVARTSILSKFWRNIWCTHPFLILDSRFHAELNAKKEETAHKSEFVKVFNMILSVHTGPILYFHLYITPKIRYCSIHLWINQLSEKGLRNIDFVSAEKDAYLLPLASFSCPELTLLRLYNWAVGPSITPGSFTSLTKVGLFNTSIIHDMTFGTQVKELQLQNCEGAEHIARQFSRGNNLQKLYIEASTKINRKWLQRTRKLVYLGLVFTTANSNIMKGHELINILRKIPTLSFLYLDGPTLEILGPPPPDVTRPTTKVVNLRKLALYRLKLYKICQISNVVYLIRCFPNLQDLCIELILKSLSPTELTTIHYLESLEQKDMSLDQLQTAKIKGVMNSKYILQFIKHLLASSPSLKVISLSCRTISNDPQEKLRIKQKLQQFPKLSSDAQIIWC